MTITNIQMKATEQYFHVVALFIMLYKVIRTFKPLNGLKCVIIYIQMKAIQQYFHVVLFIINMRYKVVQTFTASLSMKP